MKRKAVFAALAAAIVVIGAISVFALDYNVPEGAGSITARFYLMDEEPQGDEFSMSTEDGQFTIHITGETIIYFEDYVPMGDDTDEVTQMVREVLFGRTLAEVLDGRNMRVLYEESDQVVPISIMVLFEAIMTLPETVDLSDFESDDEYIGAVTLPGELDIEDFGPILNGEIVVNGAILENAPQPFYDDAQNAVMVPLRIVAEALGYDVNWDEVMRSIRLGVAIHLWIGNTEVHVGRMAPIELPVAPAIIDEITFVPMEFFREALGQTVYVFEGQLVIDEFSDME